MAALAAGGDGARADPLAELDHRDEAVAVGAVQALRARLRRAPNEASEPHSRTRTATGMLGAASLNGGVDRRRDALEAVDLAPRHLPAAEVALQAGRAPCVERLRASASASVSRARRIIFDDCPVRSARSTQPSRSSSPQNTASVLRRPSPRSSGSPSSRAPRSAAPSALGADRSAGSASQAATSAGPAPRSPAGSCRRPRPAAARASSRWLPLSSCVRVDRRGSSRRPCPCSSGNRAGFGLYGPAADTASCWCCRPSRSAD